MKSHVCNKIPRLICTGCGLCESMCPMSCIKLVEDEAGFFYPEIDERLCINCGICSKRCPQAANIQPNRVIGVYAAYSKNTNILKNSTSGGVFSQLATWYLNEKKGLVCGAAYNEKLEVEHVIIDDIEDLHRLQGSKYVQSRIHKLFCIIEESLKEGRFVLFSGTGCQTASLLNYLGKEYDNLLVVELVCHGVPSSGLFRKYVRWLSDKSNTIVTEYRFRTKRFRPTGEHSVFYYGCVNNICLGYSYEDPYYGSFLAGRTLRPCCYQCRYKGQERFGDITLGDFWGIEKSSISLSTQNGVSLVMVNTDKGSSMFKDLSPHLVCATSTYEFAIKKNPSICESVPSCKCKVDYTHPFLFDTELISICNLKNKIKNRLPWRWKFFLKRFF